MTEQRKVLLHRAMPAFLRGSLVKQILVALVLGALVAYFAPDIAKPLGFLGKVFISALKAVAPVLVFALVCAAIANHQGVENSTQMRPILILYLIGTFAAAATAVVVSFAYPVHMQLVADGAKAAAPGGIAEVLENLVLSVVDNPVHAVASANYIGILAWAIGLGFALRRSGNRTREVMNDFSDGVEFVVRIVIQFAPFGIFGLVADTFASEGFSALIVYGQLLVVLIGCMLFVALVVNPLIVWFCIRKNPFPLTFQCLRESGVTAFFTRSSAANIPVNMNLCRKLRLDENTFSISIPLGATINMAGAAITITVLALAACTTLDIHVDVWTAILLSVVASLCACGAAGVPGGSLMLIPLACGLFGIDNTTAMQVVAVGFIIGVLQDSAETALNSSSDVLFTAAACYRAERLSAKEQAAA